jgi:hypothetical protein
MSGTPKSSLVARWQFLGIEYPGWLRAIALALIFRPVWRPRYPCSPFLKRRRPAIQHRALSHVILGPDPRVCLPPDQDTEMLQRHANLAWKFEYADIPPRHRVERSA